jgi:hypothetical protein
MDDPSMVVHAGNSSFQEAESEGCKVQGQPVLHSETLSQKKVIFG